MKKRDSENFPFSYLAETQNSPRVESFPGPEAQISEKKNPADASAFPNIERSQTHVQPYAARYEDSSAYPEYPAYSNDLTRQEPFYEYPLQQQNNPRRRTLDRQIQILAFLSMGLFLIVLLLAYFAFPGLSSAQGAKTPKTSSLKTNGSQNVIASDLTASVTPLPTSTPSESTVDNDPNSLANLPPSAEHPVIALTFDDGPAGAYTTELLGILKDKNVHATFFVLGNRVAEEDPAILLEMVADGHEIGNHSYDHSLYTDMTEDQIHEQLQQTNDAVFLAAGVYPTVMRPPSGNTNDAVFALSTEMNLPVVNWSWETCPEDWLTKNQTVDYISNHVIDNASNGQIVLLHDIHEVTVDSVSAMIDGLIAKGYRFATVSELLSAQPGGMQTGVLYYNASFS